MNTEYKLRTHLISPTIDAHPIFKSLESLDTEKDTHDEYSDELLLKIVHTPWPEKDTHDEYSDELLLKIVHTPWPFTLLPEHNSEISLKRETLV